MLAFSDLGRDFEQQSGNPKVVFGFGSSGLLARQVGQGAPFDVFAAADRSFVDQEGVAGAACDPATRATFALGRLAIWTRSGPGVAAPPASVRDVAAARFVRIAIANPDYAPYGRAAREALETSGVWDEVRGRVIFAENVRHALQLAETGNAEAAFVALSLARMATNGTWPLVDQALHAPIEQVLIACRRGANPEAGKKFAQFVMSVPGRIVMQRHGFTPPRQSPSF